MDITGIITALICHLFWLTLRGDCTRLDDEGDLCMNGINIPARLERKEKQRVTCALQIEEHVWPSS